MGGIILPLNYLGNADELQTTIDSTGKYKTNDFGATWLPVDPQSSGQLPIVESNAVSDPRGTMANVLRGMSDDFFNTAIPVKNDLIKMTTYNGNSGVVDDLKAQGAARVDTAFKNAGEEASRNAGRYGMQLTERQQTAQDSALALGKSAAEVDAQNRANQFQKDLNKQLVSGMSSPYRITK